MAVTVLKGVALGAVMFFLFSLIYLRAWGMLSFSSQQATGLEALVSLTVGNYLYWIAGALMLALGCVIMLLWPIKVA